MLSILSSSFLYTCILHDTFNTFLYSVGKNDWWRNCLQFFRLIFIIFFPTLYYTFLRKCLLSPNALPSWCYASVLSAGQMNPCFRDMLWHLSRICVDIPQQISLIKSWRDTDLNIFTAGGGLQTLCHVMFFFFPFPSALVQAPESLPFS